MARQCLAADQLDEVLAIVAPEVLGDGTPLFGVPGGRHVDLARRSVTVLPHAVMIWMDVVR